MKTFFIVFLIFLQNQDYKDFDKAGKDAMKSGDYQSAIQQFEEAFRLNPKAQNYRSEGTFVEPYLPQYQLALAYESIDLFKANEWATQSETAVEVDVVKRNKKARAKYHSDIKRIKEKAEQAKKNRDRQFNLALSKAKKLLDQRSFSAARQAYETLFKNYPERSEAAAGLQLVDMAETQHIDSQKQILEAYINTGQKETATTTLNELKAAFPTRNFDSFEQRILAIKSPKPQETVVINTPPPESKPEIIQTVKSPRKDTKPTQNDATSSKAIQKSDQKQTIRQHLKDTLALFKRMGDPSEALTKLEEPDIEGISTYSSYHWVRALLLAHSAESEPNPDLADKARKEAKNEIAWVADKGMLPEVSEPLYPHFFLELIAQIDGEQP